MAFGQVLGPYSRPEGRRTVWYYNLTRFEEIQAAIAMMWRWLGGPKREQAIQCLAAARLYYDAVRVKQEERLKRCRHGHDLSARPILIRKRGGRYRICVRCQVEAHKTEHYREWWREYKKRKKAEVANG